MKDLETDFRMSDLIFKTIIPQVQAFLEQGRIQDFS